MAIETGYARTRWATTFLEQHLGISESIECESGSQAWNGHLDHPGEMLEGELPGVLEAQLESLRDQQRYYRAFSYGAAPLLVLLIVGGFIAAFVPSLRNSA